MRVAVVSDDGIVISQHFGRATSYVVFNVEEGRIGGRESRSRETCGCNCACKREGSHHDVLSIESRDSHAALAEAIADCDALIAGCMGREAYDALLARGVQPLLTDLTDVEAAALACAEGRLPNLIDRLH